MDDDMFGYGQEDGDEEAQDEEGESSEDSDEDATKGKAAVVKGSASKK